MLLMDMRFGMYYLPFCLSQCFLVHIPRRLKANFDKIMMFPSHRMDLTYFHLISQSITGNLPHWCGPGEHCETEGRVYIINIFWYFFNQNSKLCGRILIILLYTLDLSCRFLKSVSFCLTRRALTMKTL